MQEYCCYKNINITHCHLLEELFWANIWLIKVFKIKFKKIYHFCRSYKLQLFFCYSLICTSDKSLEAAGTSQWKPIIRHKSFTSWKLFHCDYIPLQQCAFYHREICTHFLNHIFFFFRFSAKEIFFAFLLGENKMLMSYVWWFSETKTFLQKNQYLQD